MPSAYSVPMASDVLPDPDTPTTATVRNSGTSTSMSRRSCAGAPHTPMTVGRVPGTEISPAGVAGALRQGFTGLLTPSPLSRRSDCMIWNVVV